VNKNDNLPEFNRRNFLKNTSLATVMAMMGGVELRAEDAPKPAASGEKPATEIPVGPPVKYGVIGLGSWGREILGELARLPNAPVLAICDTRKAAFRRAADIAPKAEQFKDYQSLLASPNVEAVVIATPTPEHREMALAALQAGKHLYCEAPLANTIEDAKAIARAARDATKVVFQPGLQERSHPHRHFVLPYIRSGVLGENIMVRAQSHQNKSWESTPWRLDKATSTGLMGEVAIHQIDAVTWFLRARPTAITGFGSLLCRKGDGEIADTVQGVFEYPGDVRFMYDATLCNSFDKDYEMYYGTQSAIMVRDAKGWLFYESNAELGGWVVYARKDTFYEETGIALMADATKQTTIGTSATAGNATAPFTPLHYALEAFTSNVGLIAPAVKDFVDLFGDSDPKGLAEARKAVKLYGHAANWQDGLDATILAIKANEAVVARKKITLEKELFDI
jgi:predicted dehydrogenase